MREDVGSDILNDLLSASKTCVSPLLQEEVVMKVAKAAATQLGTRAWHLPVYCKGNREKTKNVAETFSVTSGLTESTFTDNDYMYLRIMRQLANAIKIE